MAGCPEEEQVNR